MKTKDLKILQMLPLSEKIKITRERIIEWYEYWEGNVYISFSGGRDSTVLLHIAKMIYPDITPVFIDTGLEYPEIKSFVKVLVHLITHAVRAHSVRPYFLVTTYDCNIADG